MNLLNQNLNEFIVPSPLGGGLLLTSNYSEFEMNSKEVVVC